MESKQVEVFHVVARLGGFSCAARVAAGAASLWRRSPRARTCHPMRHVRLTRYSTRAPEARTSGSHAAISSRRYRAKRCGE